MVIDKNNFIIGYLIGNQLKLEYETVWAEQKDNELLIYQANSILFSAPTVEVK